jgi:hypothetical protein
MRTDLFFRALQCLKVDQKPDLDWRDIDAVSQRRLIIRIDLDRLKHIRILIVRVPLVVAVLTSRRPPFAKILVFLVAAETEKKHSVNSRTSMLSR